MTVEVADAHKDGASKGHATDVRVREQQFDPQLHASILPGGRCFDLPALTWDTQPCVPSPTCH